MIKLFIFTLFLSLSVRAQNEELTDLTVEGQSQAKTASEAAQEINETAVPEAARAQVQEMIGEKSYKAHKTAVEAKIVRQLSRFIPVIAQEGEPRQTPDGVWHMSLDLKISRNSLRLLLSQAGLLLEANEGPAALLPLVTFVDRVHGETYRWWDPEGPRGSFLSQMQQLLAQDLQSELNKVGFYSIIPLDATVHLLPENFKKDRLTNDEMAQLGPYLKAQVILTGEVRLRESPNRASSFQASIKLAAIQASGGRTVAEVVRTFDSEPGNFESKVKDMLAANFPEAAKDLGAQILDLWQKGSLGAGILKISLRGKLPAPKQIDNFKQNLLRAVSEIKSIHERTFEQGQVTFEVESSVPLNALAEHLKKTNLPNIPFRVADSKDKTVYLDLGR